MMKFWLEHNLIESPWLLMHTFLCRIITLFLCKKLEENSNVKLDIDLALSLATIYHFTRQEADYWKSWNSKDNNINIFMKNHWDMEFAIERAKEYWLNNDIINWIGSYIINPSERKSYFPNESLENNWNIDWNKSIPMISSWLVAWAISNTTNRFQDLKNRRSWEIWKLELDFINSNLLVNNNIQIAQSILEKAMDSDLKIENNQELINLIKKWLISNELIWIWILNWYEKWTNKVINMYCEICGIDDFYVFLKKWLNTVNNKNNEKIIDEEFEKFLWRKLESYEFIPHLQWIELVFKRISKLKLEKNSNNYKRKISHILTNINQVVRRIKK